MYTGKRCLLLGPAALALIVLIATTAVADTWLTVQADGTVGLEQAAAPIAPDLVVTDYGPTGFHVSVDVPGLTISPRKTDAGQFLAVTLPDEALAGEIGAPGIPVIRRLFVANYGARVALTTSAGDAYLVDADTLGSRVRLLSIQPPIEKIPGAREAAEFAYDETAYTQDIDYAPARATVSELGIVRGQRLFLLEIWPVMYNPVAEQMTLWTSIVVDVQIQGGQPTFDLTPLPRLHRIVLNPSQVPLVSGRGSGNYLIVVAESFETDIDAFATAKGAQGFTVSTYPVPPGTSNSTIKAYIESLWGGADSPDYILLVGDTNTVPHWVGGGAGSPDTDLPYACMDGTGDWYPDIAIGRFPARTVDQLEAIVDKTLYYEDGPLADPEYVKRAAFMAGDDNWSITEGSHEYCITTWLEPNGYQCDRLYEHTYGATTQDVTDAFNDGRFYGIYSGHGGSTSWSDGPPFSQSNVNALINENMYASICSFSCLTGNYATYDECFMETWIRAPSKGAAASWGSSVTSYWDEDDILQRRLFDAIFDNDDDVLTEAGPLYTEGKMRLLEHYGPTGTVRRYFEMYNLMGDPSLPFPSACSDIGTIQLDSAEYTCEDVAQISVSDCGLNTDSGLVETVDITIDSDSEPGGEVVTLTETSASSAAFEATIVLSGTDAAGVLWVAEGDIVTATYIDADDGQGGTNVVVTDTALVDCVAPLISNVQAINVEPHSATITFEADEPARGIVHYGLHCAALTETAYGGSYSTTPTVNLIGLDENQTYYYMVEAEDEAGNMSSDDNGGACYVFGTPEVPDYFTEIFQSADNDLDHLGLMFTPNESNDFYAGCAEAITQLPTDPTGGTVLSLSDDSYATVDLLDGATVSLYGQTYGTIFPGSNGYITFVHGDETYNESLTLHFALPRVAALYDDLDPASGGAVSWKQLDDRVAVTWQGVPEGSTGANTFQIELFFDGKITISYLAISAADGLAGLSAGDGLDPDFDETDLSDMGGCGPKPPSASNQYAETPSNQSVAIVLQASDDGLPDPPAAMTYVITSLPQHGDLTDVGAAYLITDTDLPYTLAGYGSVVEYNPDAYYAGPDSFQFKANDGGVPPEGGDSNTATVSITVGVPGLVYGFPLNDDPGWTCEGQWAFGTPTGEGGDEHGGPDPTSGHTGSYVYGYNLNGDYEEGLPQTHLTSTPLDCSNVTEATLKFWRWLGVEVFLYDHAYVRVSNDAANWTTLWENDLEVADSSWVYQEFDISSVADNQSTVYLRWTMGATDSSWEYCGWNIDDVEIWGLAAGAPPYPAGDLNCDGSLNGLDIDAFVMVLTGTPPDYPEYYDLYPECDHMLADCNDDSTVNGLDIDPFVDLLTGG